jgi:hypothetical protein
MPAGIAPFPVAGNTFTSFPPDVLQPAAIEALVGAFAPLAAFTRIFDPEPYIPGARNQVKFVSSGSSTITNPSNFQVGNMTIDAAPISVDQFSQPWAVPSNDYAKGLRPADGLKENALVLAATLWGKVAALLKAANYTNSPIIGPAAAFGLNEANAAYRSIRKSDSKNLILDSQLFGNIAHTAGGHITKTGSPGHGWSGIFDTSDFSLAGTNVVGLACAPNAVIIVTGLLEYPVTVRTSFLTLPGLRIPIALNEWFDTGTRTFWSSLDCVLGVAVGDLAAGTLIATGTPG